MQIGQRFREGLTTESRAAFQELLTEFEQFRAEIENTELTPGIEQRNSGAIFDAIRQEADTLAPILSEVSRELGVSSETLDQISSSSTQAADRLQEVGNTASATADQLAGLETFQLNIQLDNATEQIRQFAESVPIAELEGQRFNALLRG